MQTFEIITKLTKGVIGCQMPFKDKKSVRTVTFNKNVIISS